MRDETIGAFLDSLAARVPAPGGGAVAALQAAQSAALLGMVARYSTGPKYEEHAEVVERVLVKADALRTDALELAEDDAEAFFAVTETYQLPQDTDEQKAARSEAVATALAAAAEPPAAVIIAATHLVAMAEELLPVGNPNVVTDIAAAAEAARAAATTARLNIEINLSGVTDQAVRERLTTTAGEVDDLAARAAQVTVAVRRQVGA